MLTGALAAIESAFVRIAQRKTIAIALAGLLPLVARALLLPVLPVPRPAIQDEFSYLLASDTFAHGRLANPTPALAEHFETPQELIRPVYASKYPPLSGLVMAAAQKLTGQPWFGVWLSMGVLCAVLCWALQGWLPAVWALAGSLIAVLHIGIVSYWTESYWGGTCTAIGGALLIGALPRLAKERLIEGRRISPALAFAAGLAVLANTRPFEGFVFALVCSAYLVFEWIRERAAIRLVLTRAILPMVLLLMPVAAGMAYYNFELTGHAMELPYVAHDKQYVLVEPLLFQTKERPAPAYSNAFLRDFWRADRDEKLKFQGQILQARLWDLLMAMGFLLGFPLLACILLATRQLWRDPVARSALVIGLAAWALGPALDTRAFPHYFAPEAVLAYLMAACALRALRNAWPDVDGAYLMWAALVVFALPTALGLLTPANRYLVGSSEYFRNAKHAVIEERLEKQAGEHLVLVSYGPRHRFTEELVYNHADIDGSKVVWARSLGAEKDAELIRHYPNRDVWMVEENAGVTLSCLQLAMSK
jgi:uncharacterized membrane protein (UPF0136 family)